MMQDPMAQGMEQPMEAPVDPEAEQDMANIQAVMEEYEIDENHARAMLEAEKAGFDPEEIKLALAKRMTMEEMEQQNEG
jgi:HSP20 family molecular chaperone IbpA